MPIFFSIYISLVKHKLNPSAGLLILLSYLLLSLVALLPGCFDKSNGVDGPRIQNLPKDSVAVSVKELNGSRQSGHTFDAYFVSLLEQQALGRPCAVSNAIFLAERR